MHWFSFISHIMPHVASKRRSESERPLEIMEKSNEGIVRSEVSALSHSSFHLFIPDEWFHCDCRRNFCSSPGPHHSRWDLKALRFFTFPLDFSFHFPIGITQSAALSVLIFLEVHNPAEAFLISSYLSSVKSPWIIQRLDQTPTWSGPCISRARELTSVPVRWRRSAPLGPGEQPGRSQRPRASSSGPWSPSARPTRSPSGRAAPPCLKHTDHLTSTTTTTCSLHTFEINTAKKKKKNHVILCLVLTLQLKLRWKIQRFFFF